MLIAGAAGRDFHNFNLVYRGREEYEVVGFTATQIPNIEGRVYPPELAGELYPDGIPISHEDELEELIRHHEVDEVVFAYSDVTHEHVMHIGSRALLRKPYSGSRATRISTRPMRRSRSARSTSRTSPRGISSSRGSTTRRSSTGPSRRPT